MAFSHSPFRRGGEHLVVALKSWTYGAIYRWLHWRKQEFCVASEQRSSGWRTLPVRFCRDIESVGLDFQVTVISTTRVFQLQKPCRCRSSALIPLSRSDRRLEPIVSQTAIPRYGSTAWWEEQR